MRRREFLQSGAALAAAAAISPRAFAQIPFAPKPDTWRQFEIVTRVAEYKVRTGTPMMQTGRVREVAERSATLARGHGLDPAIVRRLFELLIEETCAFEDRRIAEAAR